MCGVISHVGLVSVPMRMAWVAAQINFTSAITICPRRDRQVRLEAVRRLLLFRISELNGDALTCCRISGDLFRAFLAKLRHMKTYDRYSSPMTLSRPRGVGGEGVNLEYIRMLQYCIRIEPSLLSVEFDISRTTCRLNMIDITRLYPSQNTSPQLYCIYRTAGMALLEL